jgi:hypothetical protein
MTDDAAQPALRALISAAGGDDAAILAAVADLGAERAAAVLVDELVSRADLSEVPRRTDETVVVRFVLHLGDTELRRFAHSGADGHGHGPDAPDGPPHATVELDLVQLVRAVFGPTGAVGEVDRRIEWEGFDDPRSFFGGQDTRAVVQRLLRGFDARPVDLADLSLRMGSDKWGMHYYTPHYERHFQPLRERPLTVLELGIGGFGDPATGGGSLRMWKRFFRRAMVYGVDIFDKSGVSEQRVHTIQGDFADRGFLASLADRIGPFDIVIDDGSHYCPDVITAFTALYPHVAPGGLYVVEDLQTSYWPGYGGSSERRSDPATSMGFLKQLVDALNHEEYEPAGTHPTTGVEHTLVGAHFYHNLAILEKGRNAEGTAPAWMGRAKPTHEQMAGMVFSPPGDD